MNLESETPRTDFAQIRRTLGRIALEIVVGFIGVYAAFALTAYRDRRELTDRRHQIKRALVAEIRPLADLSRKNAGLYQAYLTRFDSAVASGGRPIPRPFIEAVGLNMHIWEATKQAGGLNIIDVPTFSALGDFYNLITKMLALYAQLRDFSVNVILPAADHPDTFYDHKTGRLRPDVSMIYRGDLEVLRAISTTTATAGDSLLKRLARDTL